MRWCRSQKPAKSAASVFPIATGCHRARAKYNAEYTFWFSVQKPLASQFQSRSHWQTRKLLAAAPDHVALEGDAVGDAITRLSPWGSDRFCASIHTDADQRTNRLLGRACPRDGSVSRAPYAHDP